MKDIDFYGTEEEGPEYTPRLPSISASLEKKRRFVEEFFTCGDYGTAYRLTMDPSADPGKARVLARAVLNEDAFVRDLMAIARKNVVNSTTALLAEHVTILAELRDGARNDGKWAPAIAAEIARGKVLGLYDRVSHVESDDIGDVEEMTTMELDKFTRSIMSLPATERLNIARLLTGDDAGVEVDGQYSVVSIDESDD